MTTLLLSEIFPPKHGGSGRWFWEIYSRLPRESFAIVAGTDSNQDAFDATHDLRLTRASLAMPQWGLRSFRALRDYVRIVRTVRRAMKRQGATHLHVGRCLPEGWVAWLLKRLCGVSYTCFVHGEDVETAASSRELSFMVRRILSGADRLIANSQNTARLLREGWDVPSERITVLYPGCDTTRFVPASRDSAVRQQLGWGNRPTVLTVGRLQKRKGHDVLIQSLPFVREAIPDVLYAIIGDGEERPRLEKITQELGLTDHVRFLGEVDDLTMIRCYQQCDLFALPNRQVGRDIEGFGMVLVEAQSCGRPVLAGASGGTRETMLPGETGEVVACESPETLAPVLTSLLLNPLRLEMMGRAARDHVTARFDWGSLAAGAADVFSGARGERQASMSPHRVLATQHTTG